MINEVRYKIGDIEFEAKGEADIIERERNEFMTRILPSAVDAMVRIKSSNNDYEDTTLIPSKRVQQTEAKTPLQIETIKQIEDLSKIGIAGFLSKSKASTHNEIIMHIVYYIENTTGQKVFDSALIEEYYVKARIPKSSNTSAYINNLAKDGLIMDSPDEPNAFPKKYILTTEGLKYIDEFNGSTKGNKGQKSKNKKSASKGVQNKKTMPSLDKKLNLNDTSLDKTLKEFFDEKAPESNVKKVAVFVYYLQLIANIEEVSINQVFTCFNSLGIRLPADLSSTLREASRSRYGYIEIENGVYTITVHGINLVEHDLPK